MPDDTRIVSQLPSSERPDIRKPRWSQATFEGRLKHFFNVANPLNCLATNKELEDARATVLSYREGKPPSGLTVEQLWRAKSLYDSAYHPETGQKMQLFGRMSFQVPGNTIITGAMLTFYKHPTSVIFWHWINQTFNANVNYTNRSGENAPTGERLFVAYCCATGGALTSALGFNALATRAPPLVGRLVPFCAIAIANAINIPIMRSKEFTDGIAVFDKNGNKLGDSKRVAYFAIPMVVVSRIVMAVPHMMMTPVLMTRIVHKAWYKARPWIGGVIQTALSGIFLIVMTPLGCALFPQQSAMAVSGLEPELQQKIDKLGIDTVYYNKGL